MKISNHTLTAGNILRNFMILFSLGHLSLQFRETGHLMIAYIAEQNLNEPVKKQIEEILKILPEQYTNEGEHQFMDSSLFADELDTIEITTFKRYHFENSEIDGKKFIDKFRDPNEVRFSKAYEMLEKSLKSVKPSKLDNRLMKSINIRLLMHIIEDIHQPLHSSFLKNCAFQEEDGDRGGNRFKIYTDAYINNIQLREKIETSCNPDSSEIINQPDDESLMSTLKVKKAKIDPIKKKSLCTPEELEMKRNSDALRKSTEPSTLLHKYWDNLLNQYPESSVPIQPRNYQWISEKVAELMKRFSENGDDVFEKSKILSVPDWITESINVSLNSVYPGLTQNEAPSVEYIKNNLYVIERQVVLAGLRLANKLNELFEDHSILERNPIIPIVTESDERLLLSPESKLENNLDIIGKDLQSQNTELKMKKETLILL